MTKRALVVDDSNLARVTLRKMLEKFHLEVDTAESAEDALEYLRRNKRPNVIFMDHMMPGMDGFQAVGEIKKDPSTAMIPVIMYTSKEGEAYMGQARALGAVGVLPKPARSVDLDRILHTLELAPDSPAVARSAPVETLRETTVRAPNRAALEEIESLTRKAEAPYQVEMLPAMLKAMFEDHRQKLKTDLAAYGDAIALKVAERLREPDVDPITSETMGRPSRFPLLRRALGQALLVVVLLIPVLWFFFDTQPSSVEPAPAPTPRAAAEPKPQPVRNEELAQLREALERQRTRSLEERMRLLDLVTWVANSSAQIEFDKTLFGDDQVYLLNEVLTRLASINFKGTVRLKSHVGEFCVTRTPAGAARLPSEDTPIEACQIMSMSQDQAVSLGARQSLGFSRFLATSPLVNNSGIRVDVVSLGKERPLNRYPPPMTIQTAGEWNRVARTNNRVEIEIIPATP